jgi:hypothetical protein
MRRALLSGTVFSQHRYALVSNRQRTRSHFSSVCSACYGGNDLPKTFTKCLVDEQGVCRRVRDDNRTVRATRRRPRDEWSTLGLETG